MRLIAKNIKFIKENVFDGHTTSWYVAMKSNRVSDNYQYATLKDGITNPFMEIPKDQLPKEVQKFLAGKERKEIYNDQYEGHTFVQYIYE